jgi:hypothetical protein
MEGDLIYIDIRALLEQRGLAQHLGYLKQLEVTTEEGRFVVSLSGAL